jgi:hypothetical protein
MYYSEHVRVKRIERFLEKLAYASVALDAIVAVATLIVINGGAKYFSKILMMGDYLIFVEVTLAGVAVASVFALRHYKSVVKGLDKAVFRMRYKKAMGFGASSNSR